MSQSRVDFVQLMINAQRGENINKDEEGNEEEERSSGTGILIYQSAIQRLNPYDMDMHLDHTSECKPVPSQRRLSAKIDEDSEVLSKYMSLSFFI